MQSSSLYQAGLWPASSISIPTKLLSRSPMSPPEWVSPMAGLLRMRSKSCADCCKVRKDERKVRRRRNGKLAKMEKGGGNVGANKNSFDHHRPDLGWKLQRGRYAMQYEKKNGGERQGASGVDAVIYWLFCMRGACRKIHAYSLY